MFPSQVKQHSGADHDEDDHDREARLGETRTGGAPSVEGAEKRAEVLHLQPAVRVLDKLVVVLQVQAAVPAAREQAVGEQKQDLNS